MELAEYLTACQDHWSENLSKLLAVKASETITVDAELLRLIAELDEPTYLTVLGRLKQLLELASPPEPPAALAGITGRHIVDCVDEAAGLPDLLAA